MILQKTSSDETKYQEKAAQLLVSLNAALETYNRRCKFLQNNQRLQQIKALQSDIQRTRFEESHKKRYKDISNSLKAFIAELENTSERSYLLRCLRDNGVYSHLYENPKQYGIQDTDLQELVNLGFERALVSGLFIVLFAVLGSMGMPAVLMALINGSFAAGYMYLNGIWGGLLNQGYAAKNSLPTLILGYDDEHYNVMKSNLRRPQAIAWGMIESTERAYLSGVVFFFSAFILTFFTPVSMWVLPLVTVFTPIMLKSINSFVDTPPKKSLDTFLNKHQKSCVQSMNLSQDEKDVWLLTIKRKRYAKGGFILTMFVALGGFISSSIFASHLPVVFGTLLFNTVLPFTCVVPVLVGVIACGVYLYRQKEHQDNNRFKLSFELKKLLEITPSLDTEHDYSLTSNRKPPRMPDETDVIMMTSSYPAPDEDREGLSFP